VYVRCHGDACSHEPPRYLGDLSLQTSLLDACREPLHDVDDYSVLNVRQMQGEELRLLIAFLTDNISDSYSGLGRIFGYVFAKDGRILVTGPKKQFYYWNGRVWVLDESNRVIATFSYKMSTLFKWYDTRRDRPSSASSARRAS
jgi:hypothetical protein